MLLASLILVANEALIPKWVLARMQRSSFRIGSVPLWEKYQPVAIFEVTT